MILAASLITLFLGPVLYGLFRLDARLRAAVEGFIFVAIVGIISVAVVPDALKFGGAGAIPFLAIGLAFPLILERLFAQARHGAHLTILLFAALGLAVHAAIDGVAIFSGPDEPVSRLAISIVLHRLSVGLAIWWLLRPRFGPAVALALYLMVALATTAGYFAADAVLSVMQAQAVAWFQAFVAGSLLHVALFGADHDHAEVAPDNRAMLERWPERLGILAGMIFVFILLA
jgi:hypothetical protein